MYMYDGALELRGMTTPIITIIITFKLTLRGLNLLFKILSISNTGDSAADILVTFLYPKLGSFSNMEYYF